MKKLYSAILLSAISADGNFQTAPQYQAILLQLRPFGEFQSSPIDAKKSSGESKIAQIMATNRAILAKKRVKENVPSRSDDLEQLKLDHKKTIESWRKEISDQRTLWQDEQKKFLQSVSGYQRATFNLPLKAEKIIETRLTTDLPASFIVSGTFNSPIRNQKFRPTCSAFAGVKAMEILLAQHNQLKDLSEQYFYWASKPNCQTAPCSEKGSWVLNAFDHRIPEESLCSYNESNFDNNETQIPLAPTCERGIVQIVGTQSVRTLSDLVGQLKLNTPVIMGMRLSKKFYTNEGLVTLKNANNGVAEIDSHSKGHTVLGVGVIPLPESLKKEEGDFCVVVANSWGEGWGAGGYACLTQSWLSRYRQMSPFVAVTKIKFFSEERNSNQNQSKNL